MALYKFCIIIIIIIIILSRQFTCSVIGQCSESRVEKRHRLQCSTQNCMGNHNAGNSSPSIAPCKTPKTSNTENSRYYFCTLDFRFQNTLYEENCGYFILGRFHSLSPALICCMLKNNTCTIYMYVMLIN